ncbi:hypothetical protein M8J75_011585 [Diaphorina citri]|nr:hypothetical protein M8J75_011585 [Diaphorina citri]
MAAVEMEDIKPKLKDLPKFHNDSSSDSSSSDSDDDNSDSSVSTSSSVDHKGRSVRHKKPASNHRNAKEEKVKITSRLGDVKPKIGSHAVEVKKARSAEKVTARPEKPTIRTYDYITKINYLFRDARFFVIKSNNSENVDIAKSQGVWSTLPQNEQKLNQAFRESRNVLLIFSVRESGKFSGFARLASEADHGVSPVKWVLPPGLSGKVLNGVFKIDWVSRKELPFTSTLHLYNSWNEGKPVKIGRDGQEIEPRVAEQLCRLFPEDSAVELTPILRKSKEAAKNVKPVGSAGPGEPLVKSAVRGVPLGGVPAPVRLIARSNLPFRGRGGAVLARISSRSSTEDHENKFLSSARDTVLAGRASLKSGSSLRRERMEMMSRHHESRDRERGRPPPGYPGSGVPPDPAALFDYMRSGHPHPPPHLPFPPPPHAYPPPYPGDPIPPPRYYDTLPLPPPEFPSTMRSKSGHAGTTAPSGSDEDHYKETNPFNSYNGSSVARPRAPPPPMLPIMPPLVPRERVNKYGYCRADKEAEQEEKRLRRVIDSMRRRTEKEREVVRSRRENDRERERDRGRKYDDKRRTEYKRR